MRPESSKYRSDQSWPSKTQIFWVAVTGIFHLVTPTKGTAGAVTFAGAGEGGVVRTEDLAR